MQYPEVYYLQWWEGKPALIAIFTPEKDVSGAYFVDKSRPWDVVWFKEDFIREWFEKSVKSGLFQISKKRFTDDPHEFIDRIFGEEPRR